MKRIGQRLARLAGVGALVGVLGLSGCSSSAPSENVSYVPKVTQSRDEMQKAEFERDKAAAKSHGRTGARRSH